VRARYSIYKVGKRIRRLRSVAERAAHVITQAINCMYLFCGGGKHRRSSTK